jgi:O-antigen ligase
LLLLLAVVASGLADPLIHKAENFGDNGRGKLRQSAVVIIKEHPLVGTGAGTYPTIQARYRSALLYGNKMWQHAHNDYFELIITQGIVGFTVFASALIILLLLLMKGVQGRSCQMYTLQIACLWSCLGILIHSFVDFNFQLPVNTVYFWVILAMGIKINHLKQ